MMGDVMAMQHACIIATTHYFMCRFNERSFILWINDDLIIFMFIVYLILILWLIAV